MLLPIFLSMKAAKTVSCVLCRGVTPIEKNYVRKWGESKNEIFARLEVKGGEMSSISFFHAFTCRRVRFMRIISALRSCLVKLLQPTFKFYEVQPLTYLFSLEKEKKRKMYTSKIWCGMCAWKRERRVRDFTLFLTYQITYMGWINVCNVGGGEIPFSVQCSTQLNS